MACSADALKENSEPAQSIHLEGDKWNAIQALSIDEKTFWIASSDEQGISVINNAGEQINNIPGKLELLDSRAQGKYTWLLSSNQQSNTPILLQLNNDTQELSKTIPLSRPTFQIDALCLFQDGHNNLYAFFLDGYGGGEMRWLLEGKQIIDLSIKSLQLPPDSESCAVHDKTQSLFVAEEGFGVWRYPAQADTAWKRELLDSSQLAGGLKGEIINLSISEDTLLVLTEDAVNSYAYNGDARQWQFETRTNSANWQSPEDIAHQHNTLLVFDEADMQLHRHQLPLPKASETTSLPYPYVKPLVQTAPMDRSGDAADDPAIWLHPQNPEQSLIFGTNKKWGLLIYNLEGEQVQAIATGHINNVDIRQGVQMVNSTGDIAVASNRSDNSISLYKINPVNGHTAEWASFSTNLKDVYGICLYQAKADQIYTFINDKDGRVQQYKLNLQKDQPTAELVREFKLASQPEGCVANDESGALFIGEEDVGVWLASADKNSNSPAKLIASVGTHLVDDVEGLGLIKNSRGHFLVVSSQGDNSYAVFDASTPYAYRGSVRVGFNAEQKIDGTSETDGIAVNGAAFGKQFPQGILVVQDGFNLMPKQAQNFKLVSWEDVLEVLEL